MSPDLRRAAHAALDMVLDALAAEQTGEKVKRRRGPARKVVPTPTRELTAKEREQLEASLERAGYRKTG